MTARDRLRDSALAVAATVFAVVATVALAPGEASRAVGIGLAIAGGMVLVARRPAPLVVLGVTAVLRLAMTYGVGSEIALAPAVAIALFTVARSGDRRTRLPIALGTAVAMALAVAVADAENEPLLPELAGEGAQMLLPIAVAEALRSRAERLAELIDAEARSRVQAERLRIARDLHDVVAHGLSTIAIQSGVAARLVDRDPAEAADALASINTTSKRSLEELRAMVGVLRSTDEPPRQPTPADPDDLSDVLATAAAAGLTVTTDIVGAFPADAADTSIVAVHRIVQEALTNVRRHAGPVAVAVEVHHGADEATVRIVNDPGDPTAEVEARPTPSTGVGIVGMTERAEALGGTLDAGPTAGGGFQVVAIVPYYRRPR